jgi:hypothetical protein
VYYGDTSPIPKRLFVSSQCKFTSYNNAPVPLPYNILLAVNVEAPVPPLTTSRVPELIYVVEILF